MTCLQITLWETSYIKTLTVINVILPEFSLSQTDWAQRNWACADESPGPQEPHSCAKLFSWSELGWIRKLYLGPSMRWFRREVVFSPVTTSWDGKSVLIPPSSLDIWSLMEIGEEGSDIYKAKYSARSHTKLLGTSDRRK